MRYGYFKNQARKRSTNPNFWVRTSSSGVEVFHVKGWGAKKFGMSLETRETKLFGRDIPGFCWDIPTVREKFEEKKSLCCDQTSPIQNTNPFRMPKYTRNTPGNSSFAIPSFTPVLTIRSGPVWRQDLTILSPEGPCDSTCQLRTAPNQPMKLFCVQWGRFLDERHFMNL